MTGPVELSSRAISGTEGTKDPDARTVTNDYTLVLVNKVAKLGDLHGSSPTQDSKPTIARFWEGENRLYCLSCFDSPACEGPDSKASA